MAAPTFNPSPSTYSTAQSVTISTTTSGATIRYTVNGIDPTSSSTLYSGPVAISSTKTLKARAFKAGMTDSAVTSGTYTITGALPVVDFPGATWKPAGLTHFTKGMASAPGRIGLPRTHDDVTAIVIHSTEDRTYGATINEFQNNTGVTSAHYLVQRLGTVVQFVREYDIAHHAGTVQDGVTTIWGWNQHSIGIEVERLANATGDVRGGVA